jgi:hypothetical protein
MEIAHARTGTCRVVAKILLLGLLVIVLAKVFLAILALALVGALIFSCGRGLYLRRSRLQRLLSWLESRVLRSLVMVLQTTAVGLVSVAGGLSRAAARMSLRSGRFSIRNASTFLGTAGWLLIALISGLLWLSSALLCSAARIGYATTGKVVRCSQAVILVPLRSATWVAAAAWTALRNQWSVICGFVVEIASGTLVGALLGFLFLPNVHPIHSRVLAAAAFGAFLGITVGLSRIRWPGRAN